MANTKIASSIGYVGYGNSYTMSLDLGSGSNRGVFVGLAEDPQAISSVVVSNGSGGTVPLSVMHSDVSGNIATSWYGLVGATLPTGVQTVTVNRAGSGAGAGVAVSYSGIDPTTPIVAQNGTSNLYQSSPMAISVTNSVSGTVLSLIATRTTTTDNFAAVSPATLIGQTNNSPADGGNTLVAVEAADGATSMSWTWGTAGQKPVAQSVIVLNPVSSGGANNPPTFSGTIANITGTGGTPISSVDVHSLFSDTDTLTYSASPAGTAWPSGLTINSTTGIISGTVATSTTTGLKVRATDTASQTVDSNAFSVTISAPASTVSSVTVSPSTATVAGGATQTFTASVAGTGGPSQTVNWSVTGAGSINTSTGVYTAPAATGSQQTATITATSAQDGTKSGTATVTVPAASAQPTFTPTVTGKNINGGSRASVACRVAVYDKATDALIGVKTGLTSTSTGLPPPFQLASGAVAGTEYLCKIVANADNKDLGFFWCIPS